MSGSAQPGFTRLDSGLQVTLKRIEGLTNEGFLDDDFHFQVAPMEEFGTDATHGWSDYTTVESGQFSREAGVELQTIQFQSLVVDYNPTWASWIGADGSYSDPQDAVDDLMALMRGGGPFRMVAWNEGLWDNPDYDLAVTLRSMSAREKAGETDARYFDLTFTEYRQQLLQRRGWGHQGHALPLWVTVRHDGTVVEDSGPGHIIGTESRHATLRVLAKHFYGDPSDWKGIANANGIIIAADEPLTRLTPQHGWVRHLQIPKKRGTDPLPHGWGVR